MTFLIPLPAAQVQKALDWPEERSKLGRLLPLGGGGGGVGAVPGTQHYRNLAGQISCDAGGISVLTSMSVAPGQ